jgi:hypothetical protein
VKVGILAIDCPPESRFAYDFVNPILMRCLWRCRGKGRLDQSSAMIDMRGVRLSTAGLHNLLATMMATS